MTQEHPITPAPELIQQWWDGTHGAFYEFEAVVIQAARWGADQQLEQDARWLDTCALFSTHLTITPSGDALREAMRPKQTSLKEQSIALIDKIQSNKEMWQTDDLDIIRRALEQLDD